MEELMTLTTQEQARAVLHPLRQKILEQLKAGPATPSEVGRAIGIAPNKAHYHVRTLEKAGLVHLVETRSTGIVTEHFFARTAQHYFVSLRDSEGKADLPNTLPLLKSALQEVLGDAHALLDRGAEAARAGFLLLSINCLTVDPSEQATIEREMQRVRERFAQTLTAAPGKEYWLLTAWVPRQQIPAPTEEDPDAERFEEP
ncbi:MAG TPA: helix-turn-helix domain-containing protein [Symbiobacteriaceae bacterium]|nr:helix-turn-helix domain-containing protein [Symbiobacteriaceae bacterium]